VNVNVKLKDLESSTIAGDSPVSVSNCILAVS
jgi:hypothetical protein